VIFSSDPPLEYEVTPLILAAGRGKLDMVEILVENKANVNYASQVSLKLNTDIKLYNCAQSGILFSVQFQL